MALVSLAVEMEDPFDDKAMDTLSTHPLLPSLLSSSTTGRGLPHGAGQPGGGDGGPL
jgi:hypothetical protein